jgi:formylmethanofuran dehydrogenase subunit E
MEALTKPFCYEDAVRFHGHNGPFLALGFKVGSFAMKRLRPERIKDIVCWVKTVMKTPYTCIVDGIQCSSHCTFGKGNLIPTVSREENVKITFKNRETNRMIFLDLKPSILSRLLGPEGVDRKVEWIINTSVSSLFSFEEDLSSDR